MQNQFTDVSDSELQRRLDKFHRRLSDLAGRLKSNANVEKAVRAQQFSNEVKAVFREMAAKDPKSMLWILQNCETASAIQEELHRRAALKN